MVAGLQLILVVAQEAAADTPGLLVQLTPWGVLTGALSLFTVMWRTTERSKQETVAAERRRADDWRAAATVERQRADELSRQLLTLLGAVKDTAGAA